jgi:hypothetical protein
MADGFRFTAAALTSPNPLRTVSFRIKCCTTTKCAKKHDKLEDSPWTTTTTWLGLGIYSAWEGLRGGNVMSNHCSQCEISVSESGLQYTTLGFTHHSLIKSDAKVCRDTPYYCTTLCPRLCESFLDSSCLVRTVWCEFLGPLMYGKHLAGLCFSFLTWCLCLSTIHFHFGPPLYIFLQFNSNHISLVLQNNQATFFSVGEERRFVVTYKRHPPSKVVRVQNVIPRKVSLGQTKVIMHIQGTKLFTCGGRGDEEVTCRCTAKEEWSSSIPLFRPYAATVLPQYTSWTSYTISVIFFFYFSQTYQYAFGREHTSSIHTRGYILKGMCRIYSMLLSLRERKEALHKHFIIITK